MALKSKFFRVATEGDTTDGRVIERDWIQQMAESYDRNKYAARVWMEHIRSFSPDGPFGAYGDVTALEAREVEDKKLALFAQIAPLPSLVSLNQAKQKLYTSMEVATNFAKTGAAYLMGLAVTDSPASLGTEMLEFAAKNPQATPLAGRKQNPDNLFSVSRETAFVFAEEPEHQSLADRVLQLFSKSKAQAQQAQHISDDFSQAIEVVVGHVSALESRLDAFAGQAQREQALMQQIDDLKTQFTALQEKLSTEDANPGGQRPPATGGSGQSLAEC